MKKIKEIPRKAVEKVIKVFATIHHAHYSEADMKKIHDALKKDGKKK